MEYRLYFLDASRQIKDVSTFDAETDQAAIVIAEDRAEMKPVELWNLARCVMRTPYQTDVAKENAE